MRPLPFQSAWQVSFQESRPRVQPQEEAQEEPAVLTFLTRWGRVVQAWVVSVKHDKYKQVRLLPETAKLIERFRRKNPEFASTPKLVNVIVLNWLEGRVK